ncbi:MAG: 1-acyl-sn-glycerol-3-phosphate acyltransferase, partial [Actinobacteria bacterium]|nr:1-acyl-sn-glycerol-3-phosphate acyltransferase [Actinomycetota bacterium]
MDERLTAHAGRNGGRAEPAGLGDGDASHDGGPGAVGLGAARLLERAVRSIARAAQAGVPEADLDERDPDYIREKLPLLWLACSLWHRSEVRGLGNVPEDGPVLMVGNHSGGNMTPDTLVFTLAFSTHFGVERRFHQLAHNLVVSMPYLSFLRRYGTVAASHENAERALRAGAAVLVYPGGDWEVHRPSWQSDRVDFAGRRGWVGVALRHDVPIVPVVAIGGQETALFVTRGERIARGLRLDRLLRLKVLPVS